MLTMTPETHAQVDPDHSCPRCRALKARMRNAAEVADSFCVSRFGTPQRGGKVWTRIYHDALS